MLCRREKRNLLPLPEIEYLFLGLPTNIPLLVFCEIRTKCIHITDEPLSHTTAYNHHNVFTFTLAYQKDERAKPGNFLTKRCSFSLPTMKCLSPHDFSLSPGLQLYFLPLSPSLQPSYGKCTICSTNAGFPHRQLTGIIGQVAKERTL
jgi:hypothetical protein